jgi:hypothetical protein
MRITKEMANSVTRNLLRAKYEEIQEYTNKVKDFATSIYLNQIPSGVMKLWNSNPQYMQSTYSVRLVGNGFNYEYQSIENLPTIKACPELKYSVEEGETLLAMRAKLSDLEKATKELFKEVEQTLISLGTYKRVTENFPEAVPFLPKIKNSEIIIDLTTLRNKIK